MNVPSEKPQLLFDGDCYFCRTWIERWKEITGERVAYAPSPKPIDAVELVMPDGKHYSAAEAVFRTLAISSRWRWLLTIYKYVPGFKPVSEGAYRLVAGHRPFFSRLTRILWGESVKRPTYLTARWVFLRCLGLIYLMAFVSLWTQADGLLGSRGILPMKPFFEAIRDQLSPGLWFQSAPTIFWFNQSDAFLHVVCGVGVLFSLLLTIGLFSRSSAFVVWALYLSLVTVGRDFLSFQWDVLLLEAGFLAIFLDQVPSRILIWLFHWLVFRLIFTSGMVKWMSGDASWHHLTALAYHYETQPLPTLAAWFTHQAPLWFQKMSTGFVFFVEGVVPFLIFFPRRVRHRGAGVLIFLQMLIFLTGNYGIFNLLSVALCLMLLDDSLWPAAIRQKPQAQLTARRVPQWILILLFIVCLISTGTQTLSRIGFRSRWPAPLQLVTALVLPLHSFNTYGLFSVMTTTRPEIIVEGSMDGETWAPYEFKYKAGDVNRAPTCVAPHMPRLDWQMWFAALETYKQNRWFINFCLRLLDGSPSVTRLLKSNPFAAAPPRFVRATLYDYRFTTPSERRQTGAWWKREDRGEYLPAIRLKK